MKNWQVVCIILGLTFFIGLYIKLADFNPPVDTNKVLIERINKLEKKLDLINSKKDSIRTVIDSTHVKIITNEKHFKENVNTIISQPDSFSDSFTRQYILNYAASRGYNIRRTSETK